MEHLRDLEADVSAALGDETLQYVCDISGGIVNRAALFRSNQSGQSFFVKYNGEHVAQNLFQSECSSLHLLASTHCVTVPTSVKVFQCPDGRGSVHVLEHIPDLKPLSDYWALFGQQIGRLHTYNRELLQRSKSREKSVHKTQPAPVSKFGNSFEHFIGTFTPGLIWRDTWQELFIGDILSPLVTGLVQKYGDRLIEEKWAWLQLHLHKVFDEMHLVPAINHGDLCVANFGQTDQGPVLYDPSVQYGHSQFDLILSHMETKFDDKFFEEYHKILPKDDTWERVMLVYELFYNVAMWYHVDEAQFRSGTHSSAERVREMLQKTYGVS